MKRSTAHDFNNVFSTILANCEMMQDALNGKRPELERIFLACEQGLELVRQHRKPDTAISVQAVEGHKPVSLNAAKILVLDDEVDFVNLISRWTDQSLAEVYGFTDEREAIQFFRENKDGIDAVITDLKMPKLSGVEVCGALKQIQRDIPIIITTGYGEDDALQKILETCASEYLPKPFSRKTLIGTLERTLCSCV